MSDYRLKFWPVNNIKEVKTEKITEGLQRAKIIGEVTEFWGERAFKPGELIQEYFEPKLERNNSYFNTIVLKILENDYGVVPSDEDFEFVDKSNVVVIDGGEGAFEEWTIMCNKLKAITGDDYEGGWEIL